MYKGQKYSESLRKFALTLRYYSLRAYEYVGNKFDKNLPHTSTINKWYQQSSVQCESGICKRSIELIKAKVLELKAEGKKHYCGIVNTTQLFRHLYTLIVHNEMAIRQHVQYLESKKQWSRFITYGKVPEDVEYLPYATHALVLLLSGINIKFNLQIAHYFIASLEGIDKVILLLSIIKVLTDSGVKVLTSIK